MRTLFAFLLTCHVASAADGVYTLKTDLGNSRTGYGVCTCVGAEPERFLFLTCSHLVDGGTVSIVVSEPEFTAITATATVLAVDPDNDLALVSVRRKAGGVSLPVWAIAAPVAGAAQQWTRELIPLNSQIDTLNNNFVEPTLTTLIEAEEGDSGSPIVQNGKLVGIVFGRPAGKAQYRCGPGGCYWEPGIVIRSPVQPVQIPMQTLSPYCRPRGTTYAVPGDYISQWQRRVVINQGSQSSPAVSLPSSSPQPAAAQQSPSCSCREQFAAIERRLSVLESAPARGAQGDRGPAGPQGPVGLAGPPPSNEQIAAAVAAYMRLHPVDARPTQEQVDAAIAAYLENNPPAVTVIVEDNGKQVFHRSGVPAGTTVRVPIQRVTDAR